MATTLTPIPEKTRWEIATQGLTGAFTAISSALQKAVGQKGFEEFNGALWYQAGKGAKPLADSLGLPTGTPREIEEVAHIVGQASMGPELNFEIVEATADRCVGQTTQCPWHNRWKEQGLDFDPCGAGHQGWGEGAVESLNPDFTFKLLKNMNRGDAHCEWVIERKQ